VPAVRARATATAPDSSARVSRAARPPAHGARAPHRPRLRRARPGGWAATRGVRGRSWGGAGAAAGVDEETPDLGRPRPGPRAPDRRPRLSRLGAPRPVVGFVAGPEARDGRRGEGMARAVGG